MCVDLRDLAPALPAGSRTPSAASAPCGWRARLAPCLAPCAGAWHLIFGGGPVHAARYEDPRPEPPFMTSRPCASSIRRTVLALGQRPVEQIGHAKRRGPRTQVGEIQRVLLDADQAEGVQPLPLRRHASGPELASEPTSAYGTPNDSSARATSRTIAVGVTRGPTLPRPHRTGDAPQAAGQDPRRWPRDGDAAGRRGQGPRSTRTADRLARDGARPGGTAGWPSVHVRRPDWCRSARRRRRGPHRHWPRAHCTPPVKPPVAEMAHVDRPAEAKVPGTVRCQAPGITTAQS